MGLTFDSQWQGGPLADDWNTAGNWDGGVPGNSEDVAIHIGTSNITANLDQSAVTGLDLSFGRGFSGTIGTAANPLKVGATSTFWINTPFSNAIHLHPTTADEIHVINSAIATYAVHLVNGTATAFFLYGGSARIGASATATTVYVMGGLLTTEATATITNLYQMGGIINNECELTTTIDIRGGTLNHMATSDPNLGTVSISGGTLNLECKGATITKLNVYAGGRVDGSRVSYANTITNADVWRGGSLILNENFIHTNPVNKYGGTYAGPGSVTVKVPDYPL